MSTTAGVTNSGYVAISPLAITALLLGLASALALFGWLLLAIPLVGLIFGIVAMSTIKDSNGTQSGKGLAILGILLCLGFGGGEIAKEVIAIASVHSDKEQISKAMATAGKLVGEQNYQQAYALFDDSFKAFVTPDHFKNTWQAVQNPKSLGRLESMEWNGVVEFEMAGGSQVAITKAKIKFANSQDERVDVFLRKIGDKWLILRLPNFFPEPKPTASKKDTFSDPSLDR